MGCGSSTNANNTENVQDPGTPASSIKSVPVAAERSVPAKSVPEESAPVETKDPNAEKVAQIMALKAEWPDNIAVQCFDKAYYDSLSDDLKPRFLKCLDSGCENPDSGMGCYANSPDDYETFKGFFKPALERYHKVDLSSKVHINNWDFAGVEGLPEDGNLDLSKLGLPELSMRVRTGRNLSKYPLPASMTKQDRVDMEVAMGKVFDTLIENPDFGGEYVSISPGHAKFVDEARYQELVDAHIMFKDMAADPYLNSAGISGGWPYGRGCYISADKQFIIWLGEEDHLRIMCMQKGTMLNAVFDRLKSAIDVVEGLIEGGTARHPEFGVVTSCPTNIGTGMRASVHIPLPNLTADGTDAKAKAIAKPLGLSVRGLGGEHTPIGSDGTVDISPSARFCISEAEIVTALYLGLGQLKAAEDGGSAEAAPAAAPAGADNDMKVAQIMALKAEWPDNIAVQCFDKDYYDSLFDDLKPRFLKCLDSGRENPDSGMGCYANSPDDYETFKGFFKPALERYHKVDLSSKVHINNWDFAGVEGLPEDGNLDLSKLGLPELSMRVRTGRNLSKYPLPASMTQQDRVDMEVAMGKVFDTLIENPDFGGEYVSISPGHAKFVDEARYQELVDAHIMFKDMAADPYLNSAGISGGWPYGRGCYISADKQFIIWLGEEDHLRIMCMQKGTMLNAVFDRLKSAIDVVEGLIEGGTARHPEFGVVTSCPTNIGTGMRASVHIPLPNLTADGTDAKAKAIAKPLGLSVRGLGGEHTPIGSDGTVDISPSARFCISEAEIVTALYLGLGQLKAAEDGGSAEAAPAEAAGGGGDANDEKVAQIMALKAEWPDNIAVQCFDKAYYDSLFDDLKPRFLKCLDSGRENPDSGMGCYANSPDDYETFKGFFKPALERYHKVDLSSKVHINNWDFAGVEGLPEDGNLDLSKLGLPELSMRVRTGRNLSKYPLPASMTQQDRVDMEVAMGKVFDTLIENPDFGGEYVSISPGHAKFVDEARYQELVDAHIMFKDMAADPYLNSAGISGGWPYGRGCYISADKQFIIWLGEEDHLRIMCMQKGTMLNAVFDRLKSAIDVVEGLIEGGTARHPEFGVVTSCPTNIGTGMRASVHIPLPNLTADGTDAKAKAIAKPLGLSVRGLGGEHTPIGSDGTVDISPSARFCISEAEIVTALYLGLGQLKAAEDEC
eukprot:gene2682-12915_t